MTQTRTDSAGGRWPSRVGRVVLIVLLLVGLALAMVDPITLAIYLPYASVGGYLVHRRPRNIIGWLLIGIGLAFLATTTPSGLDIEQLRIGTATFRDQAYAWVGVWAGGAGFMLYAALAVVFPSGHLPAGRWGWVAIAALAVGALVVAIPAFVASLRLSPDLVTEILVPNPLGLLPDPSPEALPALQVMVTAVPISILAGSVMSLLVRYRRALGIEALQIRWLLAAIAFVVFSVVFGLIAFVASGMTVGLVWIPALIAYPSVALAVGVAVTRYRLFEIDRIISRTVGWAVVSGVLVAVFVGGVFALQAVLAGFTQGETLAVAASTLVAFALFQPVRRRVQRAVDHRFDRARYDSERIAAAFGERLRDVVDLDTLAGTFEHTVVDAMRPSAAALWLPERGSR